jgi:signal transduction histidine kinase/CheY-like chemotaxis protein
MEYAEKSPVTIALAAESNRSQLRLAKLIGSLQGGVLVEDETRHIALTNQAFCTMFAIPVPPEVLTGTDCSQSAEQSKHMFADPEGFVERITTILQERTTVIDEIVFLRDGRVFSRDYVPVDDDGRYMGHLWHYRDITLGHQFKLRADRLLQLETTTKEFIRLFMQSDDVDVALNQALALLGTAVNVSRAYLFRIRENERFMDNTHEWCAEGVSPEIDNLKGLPLDEMFPSLFPLLREQDLIAPQHISELPEDLSGVLEPQNIQTILWVPLRIDNRIEGFFGYDETRSSRQWLPEEITAARLLAESYSRALEREQSQQALLRTRDEALRVAELRSQFVANMSHEIRTPLTGVMGMLELLLETTLDQEQQDFAIESFSSAERLMGIINQILDFSKLEANKVTLETEAIDLRAIATEVSMTFLPQLRSKKLQTAIEIDPQVPHRVFGDAARLRQVLVNLMGNAIKFTANGSIILSITHVGIANNITRLRFAVRDTGIGIPLDKQQVIFESFVQADGGTTRKYGGLGLGLATSRQLVGLMGGEISIESEVNVGSAFSFTLALPIAQESSSSKAGLPMLKPRKILIIDNNKTARFILAQQLIAWGMHVSQHNSINEFLLGNARPVRYDFLFMRAGLSNWNAIMLLAPRVITLANDVTDRGDSEDTLRWPLDQSQLYNLLAQSVDINSPVTLSESESFDRILIVDDYVNNAKLVQSALSDMPIRVDHLENGEALLDTLDKQPYNMILMDMQMPFMDGRELTRKIRMSGKPYHAIPIIAFTAGMMPNQRAEYLAAGVNDMLSKPFSLADLRKIIERWRHPIAVASP